MIKINTKKKSGYAILELLFYISFFALLSLVVIDAMIIMSKSFRETAVYAELAQGGTIMEKISREIRQAYDIDVTSTSTNLKLKTKDANNVEKTVDFLFSGSNVQLIENSVSTGNLNTPNIVITGLTFTQITTAKSKAVKIVLSIRSSNDALARVQDFYNTVVLRGSY